MGAQATLCKEQGITVVAVMTVLDCTWPWQCVPMPGTSSGAQRRRILRLATLWTLVLSALVVRLWATETSFGPTFSFVDNPIAYGNSSSTRHVVCNQHRDAAVVFSSCCHHVCARCLSFAHVHAQYARLLVRWLALLPVAVWLMLTHVQVFPAFLACDYSFDAVPLVTSFSDLRNVWSALVYVTMTGLAVAAVRRKVRCWPAHVPCCAHSDSDMHRTRPLRFRWPFWLRRSFQLPTCSFTLQPR